LLNSSNKAVGCSSSENSEESIAKTVQIQLTELFTMLFWEAEKVWTANNGWDREMLSKIQET
jgi:hypothetical protein